MLGGIPVGKSVLTPASLLPHRIRNLYQEVQRKVRQQVLAFLYQQDVRFRHEEMPEIDLLAGDANITGSSRDHLPSTAADVDGGDQVRGSHRERPTTKPPKTQTKKDGAILKLAPCVGYSGGTCAGE